MIVLYKGARGKGKTLTMVKDGFLFSQNGYKVLRNFYCSFGKEITNEEILNLDKNSNLKNCVILIDEIQIFFDSRQSMKKGSIKFSNFVQQIRKRNILILCSTQYSNTIDLRLRQHLDIVAYPNYIKELEVCEVTYMDLTSMENDNTFDFNFNPSSRKIVFYAKPFFEMYDTTEMIT